MNMARTMASAATLAIFAVLAIASGGKKDQAADGGGGATASGGGGAVKQSCNQISLLGTCTEYPEGSSFMLAEAACGIIPDAGAVWGKSPCPTDKVVGKCVDARKDALYKNETEYYYFPEHTSESAKKSCVDDAVTKGKTFTAVDYKPKEDEARASCTRKLIGSKRSGPDQCDEAPAGISNDTFAVFKMNCSGKGDQLVLGKACAKEAKDGASSKCEEKDGVIVYNFPPDASNAKDFCESPPSSGKFTKLGGAAGKPTTPTGTAKATATPTPTAKASAKAK